MANKLDPRVDSDMDGSRNLAASTHSGVGNANTVGGGTHAGNNMGTSTGTTGGLSSSTNAGPHNVSLDPTCFLQSRREIWVYQS
jgi:hypothetical protein